MNNVRLVFLNIVLVMVLCISSNAQIRTSLHNPNKYLDFQAGSLIANDNAIDTIFKRSPNFLVLQYGIYTAGENGWNQWYLYPTIGIGYNMIDLGNKKELGFVNSLYGFFNFPIIRKQPFELNLQASFGGSYANQIYDSIENKRNEILGSHLNFYVNFNLNANIQVHEKLSLTSAFSYYHISNGSIVMPNKGVNVLDLRLGLRYDIEGRPAEYYKKEYTTESKFELLTMVAAGVKQKSNYPNNFLITSVSITGAKRINPLQRIGIGADFFYDQALETYVADTASVKFLDIFRQGLYFSHEFMIGKLAGVSHVGTYTYSKVRPNQKLYMRFGVKYHVTDKLFFNLTLKTHENMGDVFEWGIGYRWYK